uniref:Uncharacterized protein n=1 Tax=Parascaris equorum TaxID=6256 RepID=A0A914RAA8_PAREQ
MYQQVPTSGITQMKASPLKRKTTMPQAASTAHELPSKLAHMNQAQYTPYQQSSPQYQQSVASPQFATQSATSVNRLSSYGSYDGSQNTVCVMNSVGQWSKRPPSRSELIRLELRHSVQARQHAASPSQPGVLSPNGSACLLFVDFVPPLSLSQKCAFFHIVFTFLDINH